MLQIILTLKDTINFLDIAINYEDVIQFVFRPHPVLKETLYKEKDWGKKRTDKYFLNGIICQILKQNLVNIEICF